MANEVQCLLLSVGGSMAPLRIAIESLNPRNVLFFVSRATRILVQTELKPAVPHAFICLKEDVDTEDLDACITRLLEGVPRAMHDLSVSDLSWPDAVDFTGGTKVMSAALVWSALHHGIPMHYVGASTVNGRDKDGVGRVRDGEELQKTQAQNQTLHRLQLARAETAYTDHRYDLAAQFAEKAGGYLPSECENARLAKALGLCFSALAMRDRFDFKGAQQTLGQIVRELQTS